MITKITIDSKIRLNVNELPSRVIQKLAERLTFKNPKYLENQKYGRWNGLTPEYLTYLEIDGDILTIPRGFLSQLIVILNYNEVIYQINDNTRLLPKIDFQFKGSLFNYQQEAVREAMLKPFGVLQAPTGSGKTIIALKVIAERKQPTLIIVHSKELLYQWVERIEQFLNIPRNEIGLIGDGHKAVGKKITIAIVNSLKKCADYVKNRIGFLIADECHRTPSTTFTEAVKAFDCAYMLGLSATPYRNDGLTKLIYFYMGDRLHEISANDLQNNGYIMRASLKVRRTDFTYFYNDDYSEMLNALTTDYYRNELIINDVLDQIQVDNGIALILSERRSHCQLLYEMLRDQGVNSRILTGDMPDRERQAIVSELNQGHVRVLIATSQLIGEGFDLRRLSSIFLTTPIRFTGRLMQYIGRILRVSSGKDSAVIYDYVDANIGVLMASFKGRRNAYNKLRVKILPCESELIETF